MLFILRETQFTSQYFPFPLVRSAWRRGQKRAALRWERLILFLEKGSKKTLLSRGLFENCRNAQQRAFSRHTLLIFLDVHPVRLRKIIFVRRKNPSLLCIPPIIK